MRAWRSSARTSARRSSRRCAVASSRRSKRRRASAAHASASRTSTATRSRPSTTPQVNALRNSYQSAFSHYLAGFVYEALGEPSLAAAGYRQAIELHPNVPALEEALAGLDQRVAAPDDGKTDVLFEIETGLVPARVSRQFSLPIPINGRWVLVSASFPVLHEPGAGASSRPQIRIDGITPLVPVQVTSVDAMARRALQDEMPGIMLRTFIRSIAKATAQYQAQRAASKQPPAKATTRRAPARPDGGRAGDRLSGHRVGRRAHAGAAFPPTISIARARLPRGRSPHRARHRRRTARPSRSTSQGRYAFVSLRLIGGSLFAMLPAGPAARARTLLRGRAARPPPSRARRRPVAPWPRMAQSNCWTTVQAKGVDAMRPSVVSSRSRRLRAGGGGLREEEGIREAWLRLWLSRSATPR